MVKMMFSGWRFDVASAVLRACPSLDSLHLLIFGLQSHIAEVHMMQGRWKQIYIGQAMPVFIHSYS